MNTTNIHIPKEIIDKWQGVVDIIADIVQVPAALIMKVEPSEISVFVSSHTNGNPYERGERASLKTGLYCETVMETRQPLIVPNALADEAWKSNPDIKLGMISYMGFPISWPDGSVFGTICVLDEKENAYNVLYRKLLLQFRDVIEADLKYLFNFMVRQEKEEQIKRELKRSLKESRKLTEEARRSRYALLSILEDQKQTMEQLRKLSQAIEQSPVSVMITDSQGNIEYVNQKFTEITGYTIDEVLGKNPRFLKSGETPVEEYQRLWETITSGGQWQGEFHNRKKNGELYWELTSITPIRNLEGIITHFLAMKEDITERKRIEKEMSMLAHAIKSISECVSVTDLQDNIIFVNDAFLKTYGYERHELIGKPITVVRSPKNPPEVVKNILPATLQGGWQGEIMNRRKDGSEFPIFLSTSVIHDENGHPIALIGVAADISERKRLEEQFRQSQKMEAIGRLAGGVAHDFNNLLTIIKGYSDLLLKRLPPDDPLQKEVEQIRKAGERAIKLTDQLLAFSRRQVVQPRVLNLNAIVSDIEKMLRRLIGEDIELITILEPTLGNIKADEGQIEQVIMNLAINARDAMPDGGKLIIETANVDLDKEYARKHMDVKPGPYVRFSVSDTGVGMTREVQSHVFEPFFTTKRIGKGTGLGLSTVYGIVKQNEGYIWVYSEPEKGTTFRIYFPRVSESTHLTDKREPSLECLKGSETILLVEDDEGVRNLVCGILKENGYVVLEATEGSDALHICQRQPETIDLLLTDVVMPRMNGPELAKRLQDIHPQLKVLYMSGYTDNLVLRHGVLDESKNFIQKPFNHIVLLRKVREVLDGIN